MNRIGIFVDGNNMLSGYGAKLIVEKIIPTAEKLEGGVVTIALFYMGIAGDDNDVRFYNHICDVARETGFRVEVKYENTHGKANLDTNIVVDAISFKDRYDTFLLMSGDSDFAYLARFLQSHGKRVVTVTQRSNGSFDLAEVSDKLYNEGEFGEAFIIRSNATVHASMEIPKSPVPKKPEYVSDPLKVGKLIKVVSESVESKPVVKNQKIPGKTKGLEPGQKVTASVWENGKLTVTRKDDEDVPAYLARAFYELKGRKITTKVNLATLKVKDSKDWMWEGVRFETVRKGMKIIGLKLK